jgi:DNA helicase-2/ATP-dependent DNA helicase PcrA
VDEIPRDLTDRAEPVGSRAGGRPRATSWESGGDSPAPSAYRLGDDVIHAAFGDGVVTAVEPGGIVVVRFARDATERKLVADLAPIEKR